jgi:hypothetical protein
MCHWYIEVASASACGRPPTPASVRVAFAPIGPPKAILRRLAQGMALGEVEVPPGIEPGYTDLQSVA